MWPIHLGQRPPCILHRHIRAAQLVAEQVEQPVLPGLHLAAHLHCHPLAAGIVVLARHRGAGMGVHAGQLEVVVSYPAGIEVIVQQDAHGDRIGCDTRPLD